MIGGYRTSASRFALAAAAGMMLGGLAANPAKAADLGGNCCADLEERIAELEATTVRKGNRKVSLTLSGQVNKAMFMWDDGRDRDTYVGDNHQTSTRFRMNGSAKISPRHSAGYMIEIELNQGASGPRLAGHSQNDRLDLTLNGGTNDGLLDVRKTYWYLEDTSLGRVVVGRETNSGLAYGAVDVGSINVAVALPGEGQNPPAGFNTRLTTVGSPATGVNWSALGATTVYGSRGNLIQYVSPSLQGFKVTTSWGDDDTFGADARWEGKHSGFTIGLIAGVQRFTTEANAQTATNRFERNDWSFGAGILHDASGLFVQGGYINREYGGPGIAGVTAASAGAIALTDSQVAPDEEQWGVQFGVKRNFTGLGNTSIFGEYLRSTGFGVYRNSVQAGRTVSDSEQTHWGVGIVQNIEAAAMDLYLSYRHHELDVRDCANGQTRAACQASSTGVGLHDFDVIMTGARIQF